ncbi:hypothetical protein [Spirosoma sp. 209]|uniref:hypothetical protein n=1 Tax=Spirosoma sp. 209 TaxID=1955701 RepID=UPI000BFFD6A2|nr:hypothetical protein [Spirosoma sp. 209]PHK20078.1 hypothetical protein VF12_38920 [Nostoc linckia z15]
MKRSLFFLITAILSAFAGFVMSFPPNYKVERHYFIPFIEISFHHSGGLIFSLAILNFLVRNHGDSATLKAVLICNLVNHAINTVHDLMAYNQGIIGLESLPFFISHFFIGGFSLYYLSKIKS